MSLQGEVIQRCAIGVLLVALVAGCASSSTVRTVTVTARPTTNAGASSSSSARAETVVRSLRDHGAPIGGYVVYTAANDPNSLLGRPGQYVSKVNFRDKRLPAVDDFDTEGGGSVETFASAADAKKRYDYVHSITGSSAVFAEYEYLRGTVFLRLSKKLTPGQAAAYERALEKVTG